MRQLTVWDMLRRSYNREYYALNRARRRAQRLASKYGCPREWRLWLQPVIN
jgi:hypothetical protein